jgi:predicted hydrocarbon binding protein
MEESLKQEFKRFLKNLEMPKDGKIVTGGRRVAIKDLISVVQMLEYSAKNMSEATIGVVLSRVGRLIATKELENLKAASEELARQCFKYLSIKGWGSFVSNPNPNGETVTLENSAIAQEYPNKGLKVDYIAVGMISAIYEKAFNRRYLVREVECVANGDRACKFIVKPI